MALLSLVCAVLGFAVNVNSLPDDAIVFPAESNNGVKYSPSSEDRFYHGNGRNQHWDHNIYPENRPDYYRPPVLRPGTNYISTVPRPQDPRLPFPRPEEEFRPFGSRPFGNTRPQRPIQEYTPFTRPEDFRPQNFRPSSPSNSRPLENLRPQFSRPETLGSRPQSSRPSGSSRPETSSGFQPDFAIIDPSGTSGPQTPSVNQPAVIGSSGTSGPETPSVFQPDFAVIGSSGTSGPETPSVVQPAIIGSSGTLGPETPSVFQPDFAVVGTLGFQNENSSSSTSLQPEQNLSTSDILAESTTPETSETTTKIPRRDPTNRIVYISPCPCTHTFEYTPVCGTDGQTYGNIGVLQCAQKCGSDVKVYLNGSCGRNNGHPGAISLKY